MPLFAVTALEKLQTLPPDMWLKIGIAVVAFVAAVLIFRRLVKMNKILGSIIALVVLSVVFFSWIYNRNEPKFMTPVIEKIAPFFPSAGSYESKQKVAPKN